MNNNADAAHPVMVALSMGLPITLLIDLIDPNGPRSAEMFEREAPHPAHNAVDLIA